MMRWIFCGVEDVEEAWWPVGDLTSVSPDTAPSLVELACGLTSSPGSATAADLAPTASGLGHKALPFAVACLLSPRLVLQRG